VLRPTTFAGFAISTRELGRAREEGVGADGEAGGEHPPEVLALGRDDVEVGRGPEVDDDDPALGLVVARDGVGDAVGADLARVLDEDRHAGPDPGPHDERLAPEGSPHELQHRLGERGDDARDDGRLDGVGGHAVHREKRSKLHGVLVGRAPARALDAELVRKALSFEETEDDVGVADVDRKEHGSRCRLSQRAMRSARSIARAMMVCCGLTPRLLGMSDASTTQRPRTPWTAPSKPATPESASRDMRHVPKR
jgi:hypothetical protein